MYKIKIHLLITTVTLLINPTLTYAERSEINLSPSINNAIQSTAPQISLSSAQDLPKDPWEAITQGDLIKHIRTYYMYRHYDELPVQESLAFGGWLGYETAAWSGLSATVIGYTSQGFGIIDKDRSGTGLLGPNQKGIMVLGQAYLKFETENNIIKLYRQALDTPFINSDDFRMVPYTYEAYTYQTKFIKNFDIFLSYAARIKGWTDNTFKSMSEFAGIKGSNRGVAITGCTFKPKDNLKFQLWNYYAVDFMNSIYAEMDYSWKISEHTSLDTALQGFYQGNVGQALFGEFHTSFAGAKAILNCYGLKPVLGFTATEHSYNVVNPWAAWPGFTSIIEEDSDLAGEKSWLIGLSYDFSGIGIKNLVASFNHTTSYIPPARLFSDSNQRENDLTIDYYFSGKLKGLWLRLRFSSVHNSIDIESQKYYSYRAILNYDF